jgi:phosphopantothenoylcysteine synthetase/decarboxylase
MGAVHPCLARGGARKRGCCPHVLRHAMGELGGMQDNALSVIVCGSSEVIALPQYLAWLGNEIDLSVRVLLTRDAERFIRPQVVAWQVGEVYQSSDATLNPVEFAKRSLGIVVLPATANMLACAALGLAATPAQTVLLASERPALFFPAMNSSMWAKASVRRHVATLEAEGHMVVPPQERQAFEMWRREVTTVLALPPPDEVTETIIKWLDEDLPQEQS